MTGKIKKIFNLICLNYRGIIKKFWGWAYKFFLIDYLILISTHRYSAKNFNGLNFKDNIKSIRGKRKNDWLRANREGKIFPVSSCWGKFWLWLQNKVSLGAFHERLERAIYLSFFSMALEFLNPLDREIFKEFVERKLKMMDRLLNCLEKVNGEEFGKRELIERNMELFHRRSFIQAKIIKQIHQAVHQQRKPEIVKLAEEGIRAGFSPHLVGQGKSGSYWMRSKEGAVLGLFKPFDEEPFAINNPTKGGRITFFGDRKMRPGICVGEAAHNEVAAFQLDKFFGFGIVPKTYYAYFTDRGFYSRLDPLHKTPHKKYGSFQEYIEGFISFYQIAASEVPKIPLDEYQTLLFFDLLSGNGDRHLDNLLIGDEKLAAIDHAYCFPDVASSLETICWSLKPHTDKLFHPHIKNLANDFPFEALSCRLKKRCFRSYRSMERLRERVALFRAAVNADLTPHQMSFLFSWQEFVKLVDLGSDLDKQAGLIVKTYVQSL